MEQKILDTKSMSFIEALVFSTLTGKSFTCERWSAESQNRIQMYVYKGKLYCQNYEGCELVKIISGQKLKDKYIVYEGSFKQYHEVIKADIAKFEKLQEEIEPLYSQFKEYERLKTKISGFDSDEEDF